MTKMSYGEASRIKTNKDIEDDLFLAWGMLEENLRYLSDEKQREKIRTALILLSEVLEDAQLLGGEEIMEGKKFDAYDLKIFLHKDWGCKFFANDEKSAFENGIVCLDTLKDCIDLAKKEFERKYKENELTPHHVRFEIVRGPVHMNVTKNYPNISEYREHSSTPTQSRDGEGL